MEEDVRKPLIDDCREIALVIFRDFEVNQSCSIRGFIEYGVDNLMTKGSKVVHELEKLDTLQNMTRVKGTKEWRRKRVKLPNTVGDYVHQKTFKWKQEIRNKEMIYTIWRIQ